jgi:hypothetical protein
VTDLGFVSAEMIRGRLETLRFQIERVGFGETTRAFWVGDAAAERRQKDDWASGRTFWEEAHRWVRSGLEALDNGAADLALECLLEAYPQALNALGTRLRPDDLKQLAKPARPRGRKKAS